MSKDDLMHITHALEVTRKALGFAEGRRLAHIYKDEMLAYALIRALEMIGEAANFISPELKAKYPGVPWKEMIATRNRLIHGY